MSLKKASLDGLNRTLSNLRNKKLFPSCSVRNILGIQVHVFGSAKFSVLLVLYVSFSTGTSSASISG